jgi:hypothetical protein
MGILSDIIEGMERAEFKPIGLTLGKSGFPAFDAGMKFKDEVVLKYGSAKIQAIMALGRTKTKEFDGWELLLDHGVENPYAKSDTTVA